jgi:orotate phosphoribosyltransferase
MKNTVHQTLRGMQMDWEEEKCRYGKEITWLLYDTGMIKTWYRDKPEGWVMVSGLWTPFYIQLRPFSSYPNSKEILGKVGATLSKLIRKESPHVNKLVGVAAAGIPIAIAITIFSGIPSCYTRKQEDIRNVADFEEKIKRYGEHSLVEGEIEDGDVIAIVDDLVTRFDSKLLALEQVKYEAKRREKETGKKLHFTCKDVVVLLDREQGARERAKSLDINLFSLIPFKSKGISWLKERMAKEEYNVIVDYLGNDAKYQDKKIQRELMNMAKNV